MQLWPQIVKCQHDFRLDSQRLVWILSLACSQFISRNVMRHLYGASEDSGTSLGCFVFRSQLRHVYAYTWRDFYSEITGEEAEIDENVERENARRLLAAGWKTDASLDEKSMQAMLPVLQPLVNYVVEDTHATVRNYTTMTTDEHGNEMYETDHHGVACQRCVFLQTDGATLHPDFTVRMPVNDDVDEVAWQGQCISKQLHSFRMLPFNTAVLIEIKGQEVMLNDQIAQQVCGYCDNLLRADFRRQFAFGVVTTLDSAIFCAAKYDEGNIRWYTMTHPILRLDETFAELVAFLSTSPDSFVNKPTFPPRGVQRVEALGRGSSAVVLALSFTGAPGSKVMKFSRDIPALQAEASILQHIREHLPSEEQDSFPESLDFECDDDDWMGQKDHCRVVRPLCKRIPAMGLEAVREVWTILQCAHGVGVVHCDVRKPNVAMSETKVMLLDWGSARYHAAPSFVRGDLQELYESLYADKNNALDNTRHIGLITASNGVCDLVGDSRDLPEALEFYPADDAISCIKLGYQVLCHHEPNIHLAPSSGNAATWAWNSAFQSLTSPPQLEILEQNRTNFATAAQLDLLVQEAMQYLAHMVKPLAYLYTELQTASFADATAVKNILDARKAANNDDSHPLVVAALNAERQAEKAVGRYHKALRSFKPHCRTAYEALLEQVTKRGVVEADLEYERTATLIFEDVARAYEDIMHEKQEG